MPIRVDIRGLWQTVKRLVRAEVDHCHAELQRLRNDAGRETSITEAAVWSLFAVVWGNVVVLAGREFGHDQAITALGVPAFGAAGCFWLRRRGFSWETLGLQSIKFDRPRVLTGLTLVAAIFAGVVAVAALITFDHEMRGLRTVRTIVGTAFGEELIHRGVLLALWATTSVAAWMVVLMNMIGFGAWHVAGASGWLADCATCNCFGWGELFVPGGLAMLLVWVRLRAGSIFAPMAFHASTNITGVFDPPKGPCP